jgi:hypothetical protein
LPPPTAAFPFAHPSRWFPLKQTGEPRVAFPDPDGSVRVIERGLRIVEHPDGRLERAPDLFPKGGVVGAVELPNRLGGGFLFHVVTEGTTRLYRAASWTEKARPLSKLPFEASQIAAGFDRLYAVSGRTHAAIGIDPKDGRVVGIGALPEAPAYGGMAFGDGWLGAVEVDVRGVLVTFDAGASWHRLDVPSVAPGVYEQDGRVVLGTAQGTFALAPSGELERIDGPAPDAASADVDAVEGVVMDDEDDVPLEGGRRSVRPGALGGSPLELAVLRGWPDSEGSAVVAAGGLVARVSLSDGRVLARSERAFPPGASCEAVRLGKGIGFVCGEDHGPTTVFSLREPLGLAPVLAFDGPRTVLPSGNGALVVRGRCADHGSGAEPWYCAVSPAGERREIEVQGEVGQERVVALADGRVALVVPPRPGAPGTLTIVGLDGRSTSVPLRLTSLSEEARLLVERGLWLDGMIEVEHGTLGGWVAGSGPFVGVRVQPDGKVISGTVHRELEHASVSGPFGFVGDGHGGGLETTDGGMSWSELAVPDSAESGTDAVDLERGASPVGSIVGSWLRVGWGKNDGDLLPTPEPPVAELDTRGFVTWSLDCSPSGEREGPKEAAVSAARAERDRAPRPAVSRGGAPGASARPSELESSAWRPFLGVPGPNRAAEDLGFDFGTEDQTIQLRGYAWGSESGAWDRGGTWLVRAADRFAVRHAIWSTAPSRTPWADAASAAEVFGSEPSHRVTTEWNGVFDPMDEGGVLLMRFGTSLELAVVEQGRAIGVVGNADEFALERLAGAVKVAGKWYVGSMPGPRAFQVLGIEGGALSLVASYPRQADDSVAKVVRTVHGDGLGIWVVGKGQQGTRSGGDTWFVFPVDPASGNVSEPFVVRHDEVARTPAPCEPEQDGWVLVHDVNPSVAKVEFSNVADPPAVERLEARLVAGPDGVCVDAMAAQVEGDPPRDLSPRGTPARTRRAIELALTDRATDRRWGFRCTP